MKNTQLKNSDTLLEYKYVQDIGDTLIIKLIRKKDHARAEAAIEHLSVNMHHALIPGVHAVKLLHIIDWLLETQTLMNFDLDAEKTRSIFGRKELCEAEIAHKCWRDLVEYTPADDDVRAQWTVDTNGGMTAAEEKSYYKIEEAHSVLRRITMNLEVALHQAADMARQKDKEGHYLTDNDCYLIASDLGAEKEQQRKIHGTQRPGSKAFTKSKNALQKTKKSPASAKNKNTVKAKKAPAKKEPNGLPTHWAEQQKSPKANQESPKLAEQRRRATAAVKKANQAMEEAHA